MEDTSDENENIEDMVVLYKKNCMYKNRKAYFFIVEINGFG